MKRIRFLVFSFVMIFIVANVSAVRSNLQTVADDPTLPTKWEFYYGGIYDDAVKAVIETFDGGYALAGHTNSYSAGGQDGWLIKTDANGVAQWNKSYGGTAFEDFVAIAETNDHGFLLAGVTKSYGQGDNDFWIVKTNSDGEVSWNKTFGTTGSDELRNMIKTSDGGFMLIGGYYDPIDAWPQDGWLIKLDSSGSEQWNHTYYGLRWNAMYAVTEVSTGGYITTGWSGNTPIDPSNGDVFVFRTDENGMMLWNNSYGTLEGTDIGSNIIETSDGGFMINGFTRRYINMEDAWIVKISNNGTKIWDKRIGGSASDWGNELLKLEDGYLVTAHTKSFGPGNGDNLFVKIDEDGNSLWNQTNGGSSDDDFFWDVIQISNGDFVCAGRTLSYGAGGVDAWFIKIAEPDQSSTSTTSTTSTLSTTSSTSKSGGSTPGFEILPLMFVVPFIILRRRKK